MEGPVVVGFSLVARELSSFADLARLSATCSALRRRLLEDPVVLGIAEALLSPLVLFAVKNYYAADIPMWNRVLELWCLRMHRFFGEKKVEMKLKFEHRKFQKWRSYRPGVIGAWNASLYMGRDHAEPKTRECGDENAIVFGLLEFEKAEKKKKKPLLSPRKESYEMNVRYFALSDTLKVAKELNVNLGYRFWLYKSVIDEVALKWVVIQIVRSNDQMHYVWKMENMLDAVRGNREAKVSIKPHGLLPNTMRMPGNGHIIGDHLVSENGVYCLETLNEIPGNACPSHKTAPFDFNSFWSIEDKSFSLFKVDSKEKIRTIPKPSDFRYVRHSMLDLVYCGGPDARVLAEDMAWFDERSTLDISNDSWDDKKEWGVFLRDEANFKTTKIDSLLKRGKKVYVTVVVGVGGFLMYYDINKPTIHVSIWEN
jgi:hypothetical protein